MSRKFISGVLIAATTLALSSVTARAGDNERIGQVLGAAATLYILGQIIENHGEAGTSVRAHTIHRPPVPLVTPRRTGPATATPRARTLPRKCLIPVSGGGTRYFMGSRCLNANFRGASHLPRACRLNYRGHNGITRTGYSVNCLRSRGYQLASR